VLGISESLGSIISIKCFSGIMPSTKFSWRGYLSSTYPHPWLGAMANREGFYMNNSCGVAQEA
jgi:hypothetical protein